MKRFFISIAVVLLIALPVSGVSIRGNNTYFTSVNLNLAKEISFHLNDLVGVKIDSSPFIEGVELIFTLPAEFNNYRDSFALTMYSDISPRLSLTTTRYTGKKILFRVLPTVKKMYLNIPVAKSFSVSPSPGTYILNRLISTEHFPIILKIEPVMKGIPSFLLNEQFRLTVKSIIMQKGSLTLHILDKGKKGNYSIHIDNKSIVYDNKEIMLTPGIHQLKINSDFYQEHISNFAINAGRNTKLDITLKAYNPTVQFDFPKEFSLYLDGQKIKIIPGEKREISPGEHVVLITVGDYTLSKKFTVLKEKKYKLSLFLDIFIKEN